MIVQLTAFWRTVVQNFNWLSVLDILFVTVALYYVLRLMRGTRAVQLVKGLAILGAMILLTGALHLTTFNWVLQQALLPGVIALIILQIPYGYLPILQR